MATLFPHLYGELNLDAVVAVHDLCEKMGPALPCRLDCPDPNARLADAGRFCAIFPKSLLLVAVVGVIAGPLLLISQCQYLPVTLMTSGDDAR